MMTPGHRPDVITQKRQANLTVSLPHYFLV